MLKLVSVLRKCTQQDVCLEATLFIYTNLHGFCTTEKDLAAKIARLENDRKVNLYKISIYLFCVVLFFFTLRLHAVCYRDVRCLGCYWDPYKCERNKLRCATENYLPCCFTTGNSAKSIIHPGYKGIGCGD